MSDTYNMPEHGWTCFHCGETFTTPGAAREHFGPTPNAEPGCVIKVQPGGERGLLNALRKAESELAAYRNEDQALAREIAAMQSRHYDALMSAEEAGYARGLRDFMKVEQQRDELLTALKKCKSAAHSVLIAGGDYGDDLSDYGLRKLLKDANDQATAVIEKISAGETDKGYCAESTRLCECRRNGELSKHCQFDQAAAGWPTQVPTEIKAGAVMKVGELSKEHQQ